MTDSPGDAPAAPRTSASASADAMTVFDRALVRRHRDRAAAAFADHAFLADAVGDSLIDRLRDTTRRFPLAVELGCRTGRLAPRLVGENGIERVVGLEASPAMAARARAAGLPVAVAEEDMLPLADRSVDAVVSALALHWVNDLPGALVQVRRALRPDGLFLGAMIGGDTLIELRRAILETEAELRGGASPRLSPLADLRDAGALMQRAGFALPVVDSETLTVDYADAFRLIADLRGMGATAAHLSRDRGVPPRAFWPRVAARYHALFAEPDGRIPATVEVLYLSGWAPDASSQQQPLRPGSAAARLADALGTAEASAGEPAAPGRRGKT
ncbi:MAG: methyltransferase domain-containing protein [Azospirillaceae bacterium]